MRFIKLRVPHVRVFSRRRNVDVKVRALQRHANMVLQATGMTEMAAGGRLLLYMYHAGCRTTRTTGVLAIGQVPIL